MVAMSPRLITTASLLSLFTGNSSDSCGQGSGFRVQGSGGRVQGAGFRVGGERSDIVKNPMRSLISGYRASWLALGR